MKKRLVGIFVILLALGISVQGQDGENTGSEENGVSTSVEEGIETPSWFLFGDPAVGEWSFSVEPFMQEIPYGRNALQSRADDGDNSPWDFSDGSSEGDGYGLKLAVSRGNETLSFTIIDASYDFELNRRETPQTRGFFGYHKVNTDRRDFEFMYSRVMEGGLEETEQGLWGWRAGILYVDLDHDVEIFEQGLTDDRRTLQDSRSFGGGNSWKMIQGGYFGVWRPFGWRLKIPGTVNLLFGEADGISREGSDSHVNGFIDEQYSDDSSLAYGANIAGGLELGVNEYIDLGFKYGRDWLYSFDATDSGIVVFPDNDDALFIENRHAFSFYLRGTF